MAMLCGIIWLMLALGEHDELAHRQERQMYNQVTDMPVNYMGHHVRAGTAGVPCDWECIGCEGRCLSGSGHRGVHVFGCDCNAGATRHYGAAHKVGPSLCGGSLPVGGCDLLAGHTSPCAHQGVRGWAWGQHTATCHGHGDSSPSPSSPPQSAPAAGGAVTFAPLPRQRAHCCASQAAGGPCHCEYSHDCHTITDGAGNKILPPPPPPPSYGDQYPTPSDCPAGARCLTHGAWCERLSVAGKRHWHGHTGRAYTLYTEPCAWQETTVDDELPW